MKRKKSIFATYGILLFLLFTWQPSHSQILAMVQAKQTETKNESEQKLGPQVKGRVLDENGSGLPGLSILIKGTTRGTSTDINGSFQLEVPTTETVLIFKYLGYETKEVLVGNQTNLEISLKPENKSLTEVVVTALGIKKQSKRITMIFLKYKYSINLLRAHY